MAITITNEGHILDKKLTVQQGGAAIVGATSILGNTGITGDLGVTGDFGTSGGLSAGGGVSAGDDSSFAGDVSIDGVMGTLNPVLIEPEDESPPLVLGEQAQGQWVEGFNADLLDGLDSTDFMQRAANGTVSAVHTFSPVSMGPAFNLGANAKGQWVDGLNSDYLDGLHGSSFLKLATAQTITARHTFNPASAGAPFTLGANALGYVVSGFNADQLDGLHKTDFLQLATAQTITAVHTFEPATVSTPFILGVNAQGQVVEGFNADQLDGLHKTDLLQLATAQTITAVHTFSPASAGAPFALGTNARGNLVTYFNADQLDGYHASSFAMKTDLSSYLPLTGGTLTGALNAPVIGLPESGYSTWSLDPDAGKLTFKNGSTVMAYFMTDSTFYFLGSSGQGIVYAKHFDCGRYGGIARGSYLQAGNDSSGYCQIELSSGYMYAKNPSGNFIWKADASEFSIPGAYHTSSSTIDTSNPDNDRWDILESAVQAYSRHDIRRMHSSLQSERRSKRLKRYASPGVQEEYEEVTETSYSINDLLQIAVECISDLRSQMDSLKGKA